MEQTATGRGGGREVQLAPHELIVTKTDPTGHITYANRVFMRIAATPNTSCWASPTS